MLLVSRALCLAANIVGLRAVTTWAIRSNCLTALDIWRSVSSRRRELVTRLLLFANPLRLSAPIMSAGAGAGRRRIVDRARARAITNASASGGIRNNMAAASMFTFAIIRCHLDCREVEGSSVGTRSLVCFEQTRSVCRSEKR
jgi:hypothetical protein